MKKFNKLLNCSPTGGLSKTIQRRLSQSNYSISTLKEFSQIVIIFKTLKRFHFNKSFEVFSEDNLLTDLLRQCDYSAMWDNKEIKKQLVSRIKFLREKCNI